jgi:hypothetical protein
MGNQVHNDKASSLDFNEFPDSQVPGQLYTVDSSSIPFSWSWILSTWQFILPPPTYLSLEIFICLTTSLLKHKANHKRMDEPSTLMLAAQPENGTQSSNVMSSEKTRSASCIHLFSAHNNKYPSDDPSWIDYGWIKWDKLPPGISKLRLWGITTVLGGLSATVFPCTPTMKAWQSLFCLL